jgi:hypothetical protein
MASTFLTFFVSQFNSDVDAPTLTMATTTDYSIVSPNTAVMYVPISQIAGMFQFKTSSTSITSGADVYSSPNTLYKFNYVPGIFLANFATALMDKNLSSTSGYVTADDTIGFSYVKYIAQETTGNRNSYLNFFGFSDAISSINTSVHSKITTTFNTISTDNTAEGITKTSTKSNPTYRLLEQFGDKLAMNLTPPRFTSELLTNAVNSFQDIPLKVGDKIIFKLILNSPSNQRTAINPNNTNTTPIPPMETLLQINLVEP